MLLFELSKEGLLSAAAAPLYHFDLKEGCVFYLCFATSDIQIVVYGWFNFNQIFKVMGISLSN